MAKITIFWLSRVFNDALVEITITLASTYITFYIGENFLGVSGVLAIVTLGIEINSRRTTISPEVEVFLHRWVREISVSIIYIERNKDSL
jgi:sodium/hydrogen exchanger 10/11